MLKLHWQCAGIPNYGKILDSCNVLHPFTSHMPISWCFWRLVYKEITSSGPTSKWQLLTCLWGDFTKLVFVLLFPGSKEEVHQAVEHHFLLAQLPRAIHEASHHIQPIQSNRSEILDNNERIQICFGFTISRTSKRMQKKRLEFFEAGDWHITTHSHPPKIHSNKHQRNHQKGTKHHVLALAIAILSGCLFFGRNFSLWNTTACYSITCFWSKALHHNGIKVRFCQLQGFLHEDTGDDVPNGNGEDQDEDDEHRLRIFFVFI